MQKLIKPMMWVNIGFAIVVLLFSVLTLFGLGNQPATAAFLIVALICFGAIAFGLHRGQPTTVGAGALAISLLMPTKAGIWPMIIGFVFFILLVSLQLFIAINDDDGMLNKKGTQK